ncbi:EAL domain-containing protein, partial [Halieaceae bacterium]|nr:EAL domain-containing protein [Halieaceae bacterium]
LADPEGTVTIFREDTKPVEDAPKWFIRLFPIEVEPGIASVQKGWQQLGTITLRSHSKFAYKELWQSTVKLAIVFFLAMVLAGALGSYLLKIILRPLGDVVDQAQAIGDRRFITISEPYTLEFKQVVSAMNNLSGRIKQMLSQEAKRLEKWQREAHVDKVTGLMNRDPFMETLDATLQSDDVNSTGSLSLIRLRGLAQLNQVYGRKAIDNMLKDVGKAFTRITMSHSRWAASRLNGSDFALLAPRAVDPLAAANEARDAIREALEAHGMETVKTPGATTIFVHGDTIGSLMTRLDGALLAADSEDASQISVANKGDVQMKPIREQMDDWRNIFEQAFSQHLFRLDSYPVIGLEGQLLHYEAPVRLQWEGDTLSAGAFLPWINRLELSYQLDKEVITMALKTIETVGEPICVNLSVAAVVEPDFVSWFSDKMSAHAAAAGKLWIEIPESMAFRHLENFRKLAGRAKEYGCHVGIEHVGHQLAELGKLSDIGIDYLKIEATFVRGIDENAANQTLLRTLCTVGHSIGLIVIAEGVRTDEEWATLKEVGADGATGPGVTLPQA